MKKNLCILLTTFFLLSLILSAGCTDKIKITSADPDPVYKVAVTGGTPVFNYLNKDGKLEGFETDLMNAIAEAGGFEFKSQITSRASRIPALQSKQVDIILAVMTITDERKKVVDFSTPYYEATVYILTSKNSNIHSLKDLKGRTVACAMATTGDVAVTEFLGKNYEGIKRFKDTSTAFMELKTGKVDAAVGDCAIVMNYIKNNPDDNLKIVKDSRFPKQFYGMAVRKGDTQTLEKINNGLRKITDNGKYEQIRQKWFQD